MSRNDMNMNIDPEWAWSPFESTPRHPWNQQLAAHLYRRAGFGATWAELNAAAARSAAAAVTDLLTSSEPEDFQQQTSALSAAAVATGNVQQLAAWWSHRMLMTPVPLLEKTTLFWHGHFATSAAKVDDIRLMLQQNQLLREYAFGDFGRLLLEISRDPAMLIYLDSATNRKAHPNENYAREIMELFCLGEGRYGENDIRELARSFTGWEIKREKFRFNTFQHDTGTKTILGRTGKFGGEEGVRIVVEQESAPEFIVTKLIRYFVFDEPAPSAELVAPLARQLRESGMQTGPVLQRILSSNLFFSEHAIGRKVRSPVDLGIGFLRCLDGSTNAFQLSEQLRLLGQGLFYPPSVKGWDGGRTWINSSTLLGRSNLIRQLLEHDKTRFGRQTLQEYLRSEQLISADAIIDRFETLLFAVPVPAAARERITALIEASGDRRANLIDGIHALCTLPEFQLG